MTIYKLIVRVRGEDFIYRNYIKYYSSIRNLSLAALELYEKKVPMGCPEMDYSKFLEIFRNGGNFRWTYTDYRMGESVIELDMEEFELDEDIEF